MAGINLMHRDDVVLRTCDTDHPASHSRVTSACSPRVEDAPTANERTDVGKDILMKGPLLLAQCAGLGSTPPILLLDALRVLPVLPSGLAAARPTFVRRRPGGAAPVHPTTELASNRGCLAGRTGPRTRTAARGGARVARGVAVAEATSWRLQGGCWRGCYRRGGRRHRNGVWRR